MIIVCIQELLDTAGAPLLVPLGQAINQRATELIKDDPNYCLELANAINKKRRIVHKPSMA
jgi:hypothetical protein